MKSSPKRIVVGKLVGAHGITGEMRLLPLTDFPERFGTMTTLTVESHGKAEQLLTVRWLTPYEGKGVFLVQTDQVNSREEADALKGALITVSEEERPKLGEDEYWIDDLVGIRVVDALSDELLGTIEEVLITGSNDVYVVQTPSQKTKMIPALGDVVQSVDLDAQIMRVTLPEGLWD